MRSISDIELTVWQKMEKYLNLNNGLSAGCITILGFLVQDILFNRYEDAWRTVEILAAVLALAVGVRFAYLVMRLKNRKDFRMTKLFNGRLALITEHLRAFLVQEMKADISQVADMLTVTEAPDNRLTAMLKAIDAKYKHELDLEDEP